MASVTSLDKDLRNLRLSRYTPQAAAEVRDWIEDVLREKLPSFDLLEGLKDGVALCKLVNLAVSPGVKFKQSAMPFVQMENISHFLRACQAAPISLPPHDVFLTVDLYEAKDPAQVLQCLAAFSRRANILQPNTFRSVVGPQSKRGVISPNATGSSNSGSYSRNRALSNVSDAGRSGSPAKPSGSFSSWSKRDDESKTAPAWNIHQYGYMGGASQGNQGIAFGARRQITSPGPAVPSLAEKEKRRKEEEEITRQQTAEREEAERAHREVEEQEARAKAEEERRWNEETTRQREEERRKIESEKRRWDEEKRLWEAEEKRRLAEEKAAEERLEVEHEEERQRRRKSADSRLNGQFLSQYQAGQASASPSGATSTDETPESRRIKELERELELAKERERQYSSERQTPAEENDTSESQPRSRNSARPVPVPPKPSYSLSSLEQERRLLRGEWQNTQNIPITEDHGDGFEDEAPPPPPRPLPQPVPALPARALPPAPRPLPDPVAYSANQGANRTDRFLSSNPAPTAPTPASHRPRDYTTTAEVDAENSRREASQQKTKAGGWASKSLLEREMERERERQREWEENQKQTQAAARDTSLGSGPGQSWDVHQYGYLGGDNQNRGGQGLGIGGARRQIIGPRPPP
ncbi:hypothetical protein N7520_001133 [Penicillium odoratum]|uniref:uncharacterized protein n=1 Tax=Penicillium odoratum TaxID=1167516 RepID=UPI002549A005|nr:uncharacterized protein N7520_001133 [Penicillium odoratum]KAJ5777887.1 hypothetical protein N7520_001133 [Penicillium odoratum]